MSIAWRPRQATWDSLLQKVSSSQTTAWGAAARAADAVRMSCPSADECRIVLTIFAIKPIRTAGCAIKLSCNGQPVGAISSRYDQRSTFVFARTGMAHE
jgi:hypothetical protein